MNGSEYDICNFVACRLQLTKPSPVTPFHNQPKRFE